MRASKAVPQRLKPHSKDEPYVGPKGPTPKPRAQSQKQKSKEKFKEARLPRRRYKGKKKLPRKAKPAKAKRESFPQANRPRGRRKETAGECTSRRLRCVGGREKGWRYIAESCFKKVARQKQQVGRALCKTPHEPRKPEAPVGDQHVGAIAVFCEPPLFFSLDPVQHLKF